MIAEQRCSIILWYGAGCVVQQLALTPMQALDGIACKCRFVPIAQTMCANYLPALGHDGVGAEHLAAFGAKLGPKLLPR